MLLEQNSQKAGKISFNNNDTFFKVNNCKFAPKPPRFGADGSWSINDYLC